jgi:hypothetical protein
MPLVTFMAPSLSLVISCSASAAFWLNNMASSSATRDFSANRSAVSSDRRYIYQNELQIDLLNLL